jgi:proline iminopeptidase
MVELNPEIEPYDAGMLDVGDGNHVYWETSGNPDGHPTVLVHGGPGQGTHPNMRRAPDPARYRIILFDQRGCGRSTPHASDPATDMSVNTTQHLIADMEKLREHLGVDRWQLTGGSWGTTLALAYAQRYPERVTSIVLTAIMTSRRYEVDWLYRGVGRMFPQEWRDFAAGVPATDDDLLTAYARALGDPDPAVRHRAAIAWCAWEDAVLSLEPGAPPAEPIDKPTDAMVAFARTCAHYWSHGSWLDEGEVIRDAGRLAGIPGVLIHGRQDLSCPFETAWELAQAWPGVQLIAPTDGGHRGSPLKRAALLDALDRFADLT